MIRHTNNLFLSLLFIVLLTACQKQPVASFTINKMDCTVGEQLNVSNTSAEAFSYAWILNGPVELRTDDIEPSFYLEKAGNYELSLTCYSKYNKFISKTSKTIIVKSLEGSVVFYKSNPAYHYFITENNSSFFSTLSGTFYTVPQCGDAGAATYKTSSGQHIFTITNDITNVVKSFTVNITSDVCTPLLVNFK